jgi:flagellar biosynthesis protein FliR
VNNVAITADQIQYFILILVRISTMIALLPIFGAGMIPIQIKVAFSLLLTIVLYSTIMASGKMNIVPLSIGMLFLMVIKEMMVGLAVGFVASFLFQAIQFAGRMIDMELGFGFVEVVDPFTDDITTALGQFNIIIFTLIFLLFNGHYFLLLALQKSFELIPLAGAHFQSGPMVVLVTRMVSDIFIIGLKFAAPVYVVLILSELAMGVIARTVPQINIFFVGLPMKIMVGLATLIIVLPMLATLFRKVVESTIQDIWRMLYLMS